MVFSQEHNLIIIIIIIGMNSKQKRIDSIIKQLYQIHQELYGQKYSIGLTLDQKSQFKRIVEQFRQLIFTIRSSQQEREKKQNMKSYKNTPQRVRINHEIRQDIERAEGILKQAAKRLQGNLDKAVLQNRQKELQNCYELLQDCKQSEQGGVYKPPQYPSFHQIKLELLEIKERDHEEDDKIDMEEQIAIDKFNQKDKKIDEVVDEIVDVNRRVRDKMKTANEAIDITTQKIKNLNKNTDKMIKEVKKADKDLAQILKIYQKPSQLCLNITLILMVLALIGVIINLIKSPTF